MVVYLIVNTIISFRGSFFRLINNICCFAFTRLRVPLCLFLLLNTIIWSDFSRAPFPILHSFQTPPSFLRPAYWSQKWVSYSARRRLPQVLFWFYSFYSYDYIGFDLGVGLWVELLRENKRMLDRSIREIERERAGLQTQEKKLITEIKKSAKQGQMVIIHQSNPIFLSSMFSR